MKNNNLIFIIADGWTKNLFLELIEDSLLPEIKSELIDRGRLYQNVVSVFPSVSLASHTTLLSGSNPSNHHIPGHRWASIEDNFSRSYIGLGYRHVNKEINSQVSTVFNKYSYDNSIAIQSVITKGANKIIKYPTTNSRILLKKTGDIISEFPNSISVVWLPNGDVLSHTYGPRSKKVVQEMIKTSRGIGTLMNTLKKNNMYENTKIVFTSDHGQKEVSRQVDLSQAFKSMNYTCSVNDKYDNNIDFSVYTNGDATAYAYSNPSKFSKDNKYNILEKLITFQGIDLIFYKYDENNHYIYSKFGISQIIVNDNNIKYIVNEGSDPLCLFDDNKLHEYSISEIDPMAHSQVYPDIIHQYLTSYVPSRSSDILVSSSPDYHFGKAPRLAWRLGYHKGSHGGPSQDEMLFPAIITEGTYSEKTDSTIRSKDLLSKI